MKKLKLSLTALAFIFGITGSVAFTVIESTQETGWFYANPDGSADPDAPLTSGMDADCTTASETCAGEYLIQNGSPVGQPINEVEGLRND